MTRQRQRTIGVATLMGLAAATALVAIIHALGYLAARLGWDGDRSG